MHRTDLELQCYLLHLAELRRGERAAERIRCWDVRRLFARLGIVEDDGRLFVATDESAVIGTTGDGRQARRVVDQITAEHEVADVHRGYSSYQDRVSLVVVDRDNRSWRLLVMVEPWAAPA